MNENSNKNDGFLLKIETIRKNSFASSLFLKPDDIVVALNNEIFLIGEDALIEQLNNANQNGKRSLITIRRNNSFFDIIVPKSLGCTFSSTTQEETEDIKKFFSNKKIFDLDELKEFSVMRDLKNNYDLIEKSNSIIAGFFPPAWLAYEQKWWILSFFAILCVLLISVNFWLFLIGWMIMSIYCYKAQSNLLFSFSVLSGKAFSMKIAAKNIHSAQEIVRELNPKSRFKYSKLKTPSLENEEAENNQKLNNNVAGNEKALV